MSFISTAIGIGISHVFDNEGKGGGGPVPRDLFLLEGASIDSLLLETADYLLLET